MRRRKKKNTSKMMVILFVVFCVIIFAKQRITEEDGEEVFRVITESDLSKLFAKDEEDKEEENIRVLIMGNGYRSETHEKVELSSKSDLHLQIENEKEVIKAGDKIIIYPDDDRFQKGCLRITSDKMICCEHLKRGYGKPSYEGELELYSTAEGIVIINELPVEKYLKAVVPSEMPASYELEALKAQAVCARSYAYRQMENYGYPEYKAHVNDSTDYQVYGNSKQQKSTNRAVKATKGQAVYYNGKLATTYYYSTSCGKSTDVRAWGTEQSDKNSYLQSVAITGKKGDYEKNLPWYQWSAEIPVELLSTLVGLNTGTDVGNIQNVEVVKRGGGNIAVEVKITGTKADIVIKTENKIRAAFGGDGYTITLQDGTKKKSMELLPSAFFTIKKVEDSYLIEGGGFGHGIGMSQNGANEMAKQGKDYIEILEMFYQNIDIR